MNNNASNCDSVSPGRSAIRFTVCVRRFLIGFSCALAWLSLPNKAIAEITFNFVLSGSCTTSAGVYDSNSHLVTTLWSKEACASGTQQAVWDGTLDDGSTAPDGNYQIKVLRNNLNYVWEGVIGNTDTSFTSVMTGGDTVWHCYDVINDIAISGTNMFIANGYCEGAANAYRASTSTPNTPKQMVFYGNVQDAATQFEYTATDGTWTYFANADNGFNPSSCIMAYKVSDNKEVTFTSGTTFKPKAWQGVNTFSVIDLTVQLSGTVSINGPTGLAVQQTGTCLAVAHSGANEVRLFHKTSGQFLGSLAIPAPGKIAFSTGTSTKDDLWVITGTTVQRFNAAQIAAVTGTGTVLTPDATITGLSSPLAVAVDPRAEADLVLVMDGGTSQQIKGYTSTGAVPTGTWSTPLGTAGGYNATNGNNVTNDKFWFAYLQSYIAIQNDGSFWFSDAGNYRNLHFSDSRTYKEQIAFVPANYVVTADPNVPTRVFGLGWLEFQVDYTKPLLPGDPGAEGGNNSWKLVRNWGVGVESQYSVSTTRGGLNTVATLSNGRTYGLVLSNTANLMNLVELPASGLLRNTGIAVSSTTTLCANGDLHCQSVAGGVQKVTRQLLTGFDASNNPQWSGTTTIATSSANLSDPYYRRQFCGAAGPQFPITDSNIVVSFDQTVSASGTAYLNTGMHLGGVAVSGTSWLWKASPAALHVNYYTQQDGTFDLWANYGGNTVHADGRNIVYGYHGEGWDNGKQANQFMHFYDDGLFVGQFGVPNANTSALVGVAGNSFCSALVKTSGTTYLYHGDESNHGGIHRWRFDGATTIAEMAATGVLSGTNPSMISLVALPAAPTGVIVGTGNGEVCLSWTAVSGATSYSIYRGTAPSAEAITPVYTGITNTTCLDLGLTNGTTYYYKIVAVNSGGIGAYSSEVSAAPATQGSIYEAESYGTMYKMFSRSDSFASNGTYMHGMGGGSGAWITMNNINGESGGSKTLSIRYNAVHAATKYLTVNGVRTTLSFPATCTSGVVWGIVSPTITLNSGTANTISVSDNGDPYWVLLDYLSVK